MKRRSIAPILILGAGLALALPARAAEHEHGQMERGQMERGQMMQGQHEDMAWSEGAVKKVNADTGKLTISHGPLPKLDMPAMTMVFRVKDPAWLARLKAGDRIRFVAERVDGALTVTAIEPK